MHYHMYVRIPRIENDIYSNWPEGATLNETKKVNKSSPAVTLTVLYMNFIIGQIGICRGISMLSFIKPRHPTLNIRTFPPYPTVYCWDSSLVSLRPLFSVCRYKKIIWNGPISLVQPMLQIEITTYSTLILVKIVQMSIK